jgi:hypothetical protein
VLRRTYVIGPMRKLGTANIAGNCRAKTRRGRRDRAGQRPKSFGCSVLWLISGDGSPPRGSFMKHNVLLSANVVLHHGYWQNQ